ncbi:MAG: inorganic diphosphatase [Pseudomonadota bacterium]|nr:inorganic diphosphatase [Pseudomonadota bacterium]MEC9236788.1 inorganic diphosphatase [Pseudomonadota bacterium]
MSFDNVPAGKDLPNDINVIIENPMGGQPIKYEVDKDSGALFVDRFLHTPMYYPGNYGYVPNTLSGDGDPVDVLVISHLPITPGAVLRSRPVGVLKMEDDGGQDEKIIAVPVSKMIPLYDSVQDYTDLPKITLEQIEHFFTHYKDLEKGKWVKVLGWDGVEMAKQMLVEGVERAGKAEKAA